MTPRLRLAFGADHAGFQLKQALAEWARDRGHEVIDCGPATDDRVDYPDFAAVVATAVQQSRCDRGVLVCGSGIGMAMAANRHPGVRAVVAGLEIQARLARAHNDANVLCVGQRITGAAAAEAILDAFLGTEFEGGRHTGRVAKIERLGADRSA
jgi:ribose 5-phosphate isomerase B